LVSDWLPLEPQIFTLRSPSGHKVNYSNNGGIVGGELCFFGGGGGGENLTIFYAYISTTFCAFALNKILNIYEEISVGFRIKVD